MNWTFSPLLPLWLRIKQVICQIQQAALRTPVMAVVQMCLKTPAQKHFKTSNDQLQCNCVSQQESITHLSSTLTHFFFKFSFPQNIILKTWSINDAAFHAVPISTSCMADLQISLKLKLFNSVCKRVIYGFKANCVMLCLSKQATLYGHITLVVKSLFSCGTKSDIQQTDLIIHFWGASGEKNTPQSAWHDPFYQMQMYKYGRGSLGKV